MRNLKIAVDGPSGAGKSSLARALAHEMGLIYVDTGALYRTIGLFMTENNIDTHDADAVADELKRVAVSRRNSAVNTVLFTHFSDSTEDIVSLITRTFDNLIAHKSKPFF